MTLVDSELISLHLELAPTVAAIAPHTRAVAAHKLLAHGGGGAVTDKHALALVTLETEEMRKIKSNCHFAIFQYFYRHNDDRKIEKCVLTGQCFSSIVRLIESSMLKGELFLEERIKWSVSLD